jgi:aquaporin Z
MKKYISEFIGTFWLVLGGCGSAVLAGKYIGFAGVALAFGLTVLTIAYSLGPISGAHLNPAVTVGLWAGGRFNTKEILPYILAQIVGAIVAALVIFFVVSSSGFPIGDFAANGFKEHSPGHYGLKAAALTEFIMTFMFLIVILGATDEEAPKGFAGIVIGLALTLIHLISIPVTNTSVNPARSISQAIFAEGGWALGQLWVFIVFPLLGAVAAGFVYKFLKK